MLQLARQASAHAATGIIGSAACTRLQAGWGLTLCASLLYCASRSVNQIGASLGASSFSASRAAAGQGVVQLASGCAAASASSASMAASTARTPLRSCNGEADRPLCVAAVRAHKSNRTKARRPGQPGSPVAAAWQRARPSRRAEAVSRCSLGWIQTTAN